MQILNIAGYKFITLNDLPELLERFQSECQRLELKGTILLSPEGMNVTLAGPIESINEFKEFLRSDARFADYTFRESFSEDQPFDRMKVKIKNEIITMRRPEVRPDLKTAPDISPQDFKKWLDENRDITVLDTRNEYEVRFGTFKNAVNLHIDDFSEFPEAAEKNVTRDKPIVMFCTGGIRCEKAALHMLNAGYSEVYQLHGGILNYFKEVGGAHYDGECFVFDQRVAVDANLETTGTLQCTRCEGPMQVNADCPQCVST